MTFKNYLFFSQTAFQCVGQDEKSSNVTLHHEKNLIWWIGWLSVIHLNAKGSANINSSDFNTGVIELFILTVTNTLHCFEKPPFVMKDHIIVTKNLLILMEMAYTSIKNYLYIARNKKCLGNTLVFFCPLVCQIISFQTTFCCLDCIQFLCL